MTYQWADLNDRQRLEAVSPLLGENLSFAEIAERLGAPSRSSISGLVFRMRRDGHLPPAAPRAQRQPRKRTSKPRSPNPKPNKALMKVANGLLVPVPMRGSNNPHHNDFKGRAEQRAASPGLQIRRMSAFDPLPDTAPVSFIENRGCKWPVDGVNGPGLLVCGAPRDGRTYCEVHRRLAYTPPPIRNRTADKAVERQFHGARA